MQYNGNEGAHAPWATVSQAAELRHQMRRLAHHPSIVLWDGCNECTPTPNTTSIVYVNFTMTIISQEDQSRAVWPSSPGAGWLTGVNRLYTTPNDSPHGLTVHGGGHIWNQGIETHGPYVRLLRIEAKGVHLIFLCSCFLFVSGHQSSFCGML